MCFAMDLATWCRRHREAENVIVRPIGRRWTSRDNAALVLCDDFISRWNADYNTPQRLVDVGSPLTFLCNKDRIQMPKVKSLSLNSLNAPHQAILTSAGFEVEFASPSANVFDEDTLIAELQGCQASVAGSEPYTPRVLEACPELRAICRTGVGFDAVDLPTCDARGIVVTTTPGVNHHAVAEHTIALLMGVARGFPEVDRRVRENRWQRTTRPRVMGSTIGIVGLGRIGRAVATRAVGLGMNVLAFEPYPQKEFVETWRVELVELSELFARSDYVTLHCPMSEENHHLINENSIKTMKPGAVVINTARGLLVDETALCEALKSGQIRAAGLDVFEVEPLQLNSPLLELDNVLMSNHIAGLDNESHIDTFEMTAQTIIDLYNGKWPSHCIQNLRGVTDWKWSIG